MTNTLRSPKAIVLSFLAFIVSLALDLGTKEWALNELSIVRETPNASVCVEDGSGYAPMQRLRKPGIVLIEKHLEFRYAENCGAAFGIGRSLPLVLRTSIFGVAAVTASVALYWMFIIGRGTILFSWAVPLIVSGALGNLFDRIRHGYVVDFIRFYIDTWEYPTFNVADATIVAGVALLIIESFQNDRREARERAARKAAEDSSATKPNDSESAG
jgi:signal peptidase II